VNRFKRFFSRGSNWIGILLVVFYVGVALCAPLLSPQDPKEPGVYLRVGRRMEARPQPPSEKAKLGMLPFGFDVYHSLVWGSRDALRFGLIVTVSTAVFGILYGASAGVAGSGTSAVMMRIADAFLAFPPIAGYVFLQQLFATTITAMGGMYFNSPRGGQMIDIQGPMTAIQYLLEHVNPLMLSLIVFSWMPYARLVNSMVLTLKQTDFVQAARALGASPFWIIRKHLLQNATGPSMVLAARDVGGVVLLQATLTFIGIGGGSVWGSMLSQGRNWVIGANGSLFKYWWVFLPPTLAVMIFGIAWNILGDGLHDVFEPTSHHDFYKPPFWSRMFKKTKKQELPLEVPTLIAADTPSQPTPSTPASNEQHSPDHKPDPSHASRSVLLTARDHISQGQLSQALHAYGHLIRHDRLVSDIIPDLAVLVKQHPQDPQVWQTLGDALSRAGDEVHAAQSYDKARKLMG
jgi:peptide/nickel transport system permease protein